MCIAILIELHASTHNHLVCLKFVIGDLYVQYENVKACTVQPACIVDRKKYLVVSSHIL